MMPNPARQLDGIIAVPATPFTDDNQVDVDSLRRYARHALANGVVGFLAPAVAGEVETLTGPERELIVATLLEESAGRVPVIGGVTDTDAVARLRHARRFIELGCGGVLAYVRYEDDASYTRSVHELAALQPALLMIQDLDLGRAPVPVDLVARLHRELPCFTWNKVETADRGRKISALLAATGGSLRIGAAGPDVIELLDRGVHAYLITYCVDVYQCLWTHYRAGRRDRAVEIWRRLLPCLAFMATHQRIQWRFTKALLQAAGLFATTRVRIAAPELDPTEQRLIDELARYAIELSASLRPT